MPSAAPGLLRFAAFCRCCRLLASGLSVKLPEPTAQPRTSPQSTSIQRHSHHRSRLSAWLSCGAEGGELATDEPCIRQKRTA